MEVIMECRSEPEQNFNRCPESHPYAYNNGYDCCASPFEDFTDGFGRRCDGSPISIESWVVLFFYLTPTLAESDIVHAGGWPL